MYFSCLTLKIYENIYEAKNNFDLTCFTEMYNLNALKNII